MRIRLEELRSIVGSVLAESENAKLTVGDVRTALDLVADEEELEAAKRAAKKAGQKGAWMLLSLVPGLGAAEKIWDVYKAAKGTEPEVKKSNRLWDYLTIDPEKSDILDPGLEHEFIKQFAKSIEGRSDEEELPDIDDQLDAFLKARFDGNHITK
jgi:hypothetical protein